MKHLIREIMTWRSPETEVFVISRCTPKHPRLETLPHHYQWLIENLIGETKYMNMSFMKCTIFFLAVLGAQLGIDHSGAKTLPSLFLGVPCSKISLGLRSSST
jgi:hypothetical protein